MTVRVDVECVSTDPGSYDAILVVMNEVIGREVGFPTIDAAEQAGAEAVRRSILALFS